MKKYIVYDYDNSEFEHFDTIEEAQKWIKKENSGEISPDISEYFIAEIIQKASFEVTDKKENYKYVYDEDIPEDDTESEAWPYDNKFDFVGKIKFEELKK